MLWYQAWLETRRRFLIALAPAAALYLRALRILERRDFSIARRDF